MFFGGHSGAIYFMAGKGHKNSPPEEQATATSPARFGLKRLTIAGLLVAAGLFLANETAAWVLNNALDWLRQNWALIPWMQIVGLVALASGVLVVVWPRKKTPPPPPPPTRSARIRAAFNQGKAIADAVSKDRRLKSFMLDYARDLTVLAANADSVFLTLEKEGFPVLRCPDVLNAENYLVGVQGYFSTLYPLIRDGHFDEAEGLASDVAAGLVEQMRSFNPRNWLYSPH
ncbi:hypothetical protein SKP52_07855 [Sphingopyxis fribergensis]|uniref:Uncharacterized protein n=1 Tax=Sphingopyxis fribergensis TaxID=1515612 RepID=A0A0A7PEP2_9SPHN|nr:hypothetical protein [Sphingopyxis fribergensis]AJA08490.1 hypothetical protein SKP52_07855 [Sphingopyxis fribergensis]